MSQALVDFSTRIYTDPELVTETESIETKMTSNPNYATPAPTIAAVTAQRVVFQSALALAHNGNPTQTSAKNAERLILEGLLHTLGVYVQLESGGDETKILSSGYHTAASKAPIGVFDVVSNFDVLTQKAANKVLVSCDAMHKATFYEILYTPSPETTTSVWITETSTTHSLEIDGLTSFVPYVFKMAACGSNKGRNYCAPITRAAN